MKRILDEKIKFYDDLQSGSRRWVVEALNKEGISVLDGFIENISIVSEFYNKYYNLDTDRIVLCGINPGRKGAGKTGIPFIDFKSLSYMLDSVTSNDSEESAQFVYDIISYFGAKNFYNKVYLTNISWFGFLEDGKKNCNYYELSERIIGEFISGFISEMNIVKPISIIPLGEKVEEDLKKMVRQGRLKYKVEQRLNHPYYCSFRSRRNEARTQYISSIKRFFPD